MWMPQHLQIYKQEKKELNIETQYSRKIYLNTYNNSEKLCYVHYCIYSLIKTW